MSLQPLAVPLGACLGFWAIVGLVLHAIVSSLSHLSALKKYSGKQLVVAAAVNATNTATSLGKTATRALLWLAVWWGTVLLIFFFFSFLYVTYTEYPATWIGAVRGYNQYMAPFLHRVVLVPLRLLDLFLRALIPLWNSAVWFFKTLGVQGLLPILIEQIDALVDMSAALFSLVSHLAQELSRFAQSLGCSGAACLQPERGLRDFLSSMADVRDVTLHALRVGHAFCGTLAAPLDALAYPLLDLNLAEGVHNLLNSVVQLFVVVPWFTTLRCAEKEDNQFAVLMCTPDLAPTFNFLVAGISNLGLLIDNWLNVILLIVETVLGGRPPQCAAAGYTGVIPDLLAADSVFKGPTVLVGLTDWLYSVTDGSVAVYTGHGAQARMATWPFKVDPRLGVAAVTYGQLHELDVSTFSSGKTARAMQTTAMLGCNCSDTAQGLAVACAILPMSGIPNEAARENYRLQALFSDATAASLYTCAGVDLYVKSVRWSYTRYETVAATLGSSAAQTAVPSNDCISRGTCRELDATVWLVPRCGQDVSLNAPTACIATAPCFPYCMAARVSGMGQANLVFVRGGEWRAGRTVLGQDCALETSTPSSTQLGVTRGPDMVTSRAPSSWSALLQTGTTEVYAFASRRVCTRAPQITSVVPRNLTRVSYNVQLSGQPFVITGDTTMTTVDLGGGVESVQVERLEGDETDVFGMNPINQELPALPKAVVPLDESDLRTSARVSIPYSYQTTRIAATTSRNFVFYASNPNADVLGPYLEYCADKKDSEKLSKFGLLFLSSYSQVRVYRVSAYRRCSSFSCGDDLVRFVALDGFSRRFGLECSEVFNVSVRSLEYLNEENIAVTVISSRVTDWDAVTSEFSNATAKTYWLNPASMRLKDTIWQTDVGSSSAPISVPQLCPELQRLPRLGTLAAEVLNAGVFLLRSALLMIVLAPGLVAAWRAGPQCPNPGSAFGHSALANCGEGVFSLDDFFDSLDDAAAVFWHGLSLIARLVVPDDRPQIASALSNVLDGMAQYGQGAVDVWAGGRGVLYMVQVPVREQAAQIWVTLKAGTLGDAAKMIDGLSMPGAGSLAWGRFAYKVLSTYGLSLLKRFLDPLRDISLGQAFTLFWAVLYDLKEEFSATVTGRVRLACGGIRLMFGGDNPWANLLYHQCAATAEMTDGMLSLIVDIFVQIPMAKCVCKDGAGQDVAKYVAQQCAPSLPVSLLPTLYSIVNQETGRVLVRSMACERVLARVNASIGGSLDGWFSHQFSAMDAAGSTVDYLLGVFDDKAGKCLDFQNDPHVVVIVPQPVDYFSRCGTTSLCKQICSPEWQAFQASRAALTPMRAPETVRATVESMFFPGELDDTLLLTNATAVVELTPGEGGCLSRSAVEGQDLAVAVAEVSGQLVNVQVWCSPRTASGSVYRGTDVGFGPLNVPGALLQLHFGDATGLWLVALSQLEESTEGVFLLNSSGVFRAPDVTLLGGSGQALVRIENLWVIDGLLLIDVLARQLEAFVDPNTGQPGAVATPYALHFTLAPTLDGVHDAWRASTVDLMQFGGGDYWFTKPATWNGALLFLPKFAGLLPFRVELTRSGANLLSKGMRSLQSVSLPVMHHAAFSPVGHSAEGHVYAVSREGWDWLKQVRLSGDGFVEGVFGSTRVDYTLKIDGRCDERGCEGCLNLEVQRLCNAYNRCALINCVGTPVHQLRPLCGLGGLLRQTGRMGLVSTQAAWAIFTEMLALTMKLGLLSVKEAYLLWPEDKFLCYICQAKDRSAVFFSILTSILNGALQMGNADIGYMYGGASNVDTNADAVLTISSTAVNSFMHQIFLYPLYGLAVSHQILMCQASGVIALLPDKDFTLRIRGANDVPAGDLIAGQCLTVGAEVLASFPQDDSPSVAYMITSMVANSLQLLVVQQIEPFVHALDGLLAYMLGVVKSLGALIQSQTMSRCNPPDFYLREVVNCPCGDHPLVIAAAQRKDSAHWCTGVLSMIDSNAQPYYVYNRYSYEELQGFSTGMKTYVECVSSGSGTGGYNCQPPNTQFFAQQGVTTLNVLIKCRENYVKGRWDPAAYMLYQPAYWDLLHFQENEGVPTVPTSVPLSVRACLAEGDASAGSLAQRCLEGYLVDAGLSQDEYWAYERTGANSSAPELTDACLVFSGPADQGIAPFSSCVDGGAGGCPLPQHLWTPRSSNDVPLATQHRVMSHGVRRDGLVQTLYRQARDKVLASIQGALTVWNTSDNLAVDADFFSVEGDVLHQTMDCIMMGPYSRVDYWPIPDCPDGAECLAGPHWSRDEQAGRARGVDTTSCAAPPSLPYTCGSNGRKSLMRYLVRNLLKSSDVQPNQNLSNVGVILRSTLTELATTWADTERYGCSCSDGFFRPTCCLRNGSSAFLPPHLNQTTTSISAQSVLRALEDDMGRLYELALEKRETWLLYMQDVAGANTTNQYDWSTSQRVEDEARFDPVKPASSYSAQTEALSPLAREDSTLWDVCHASLKQVFFTLPTAADGTVRFPEADRQFDGDPSTLQDEVRRFTTEAFYRSPLFRHYLPRHAPSESQMCEGVAEDEPQDVGTVSYSSFVQNSITLLSSEDLPSDGQVFHPQRFRVGSSGCLCGWQQIGPRCRPSSRADTFNKVCAIVACAEDNTYHLEDDQGLVLQAFSPDWHCPEFELSPVLGYIDPSAHEQWFALNATTLVTSSRDLYRHGRGGLRPGNLQSFSTVAKSSLNPRTREVPLERGRLTTCKPPPFSESLLQPFLDELFPANHGIDDSAPTVYCLRYAIELARLEVLRLLAMDATSVFLQQQDVVEIWRKRCGAQLHLLSLCVSLRVFRPLVDAESRAPYECPYFTLKPISSKVVYVTPQCLVHVDGVFYDPCAGCLTCQGPARPALNVSTLASSCALAFDPRRLLRASSDVPLGWVDGQHPLPDPEAALLNRGWSELLLDDSDATGNVLRHTAWHTAEGPMQDNSMFCDTVQDWWPDAWNFPVGYHVTVPCEANETAYRSFSQAFAYDEATGALVYQHDLLRDIALVDSHFGGSGLCRSGTFGMPMMETNNMRYCTRMPVDDTEDFTLPLDYGEEPTDANAWTEWRCTASSTQLPWPSLQTASAPSQSSRISVGTIPNMPPETSSTYPATDEDAFEVGPWQEIIAAGNLWGATPDTLCQDYRLLTCKNDSTCLTGYHCKGRVCSGNRSQDCTMDASCGSGVCEGVCLIKSVECIRHKECPDDKMCSGVGTCETPVLAAQNRLTSSGENITLGLSAHNGGCPAGSRNFSLLQGSYWGNVGKDLLRAHGMCSFQDWFKYTSTYLQYPCSTASNSSSYKILDQAQCSYVDLSKPSTNLTKWWPDGNSRPDVLFMRPTNCDRDYERLQGFTQCAPGQGSATLLFNDRRLEQNLLSFDQFARLTEYLGSKRVPLAIMPEQNNSKVGFLGMGGRVAQMGDLQENAFVPCGVVGQCFPAPFTVNGTVRPRVFEIDSVWTNYTDRDAFVCGAFAIMTSAGCTLDLDRLPLFKYLCHAEYRLASCVQAGAEVEQICSSITLPFQANNNERQAVLASLRSLFYVFSPGNTLETYLQLTTCMVDLHAAIQRRALAFNGPFSLGFYFPLLFSLYEVPFDWFFQCVAMSGFRINPSSQVRQNCRAYQTRADHSLEAYKSVSTGGDSFRTYLQFVRGGYTQAGVDAFRTQQANFVLGALTNSSARLVKRMYGGVTDLSYPRCSRHMRWRVGAYGDAYPGETSIVPEARAVIWNWYDQQTCTSTWHEKLLDKLDAAGFDRNRWVESLTTPDPVNLVAQDGATGRNSMIQTAALFMFNSMALEPVDLVQSQATGAFKFNRIPPAAYDHKAAPLPFHLEPRPSVSSGTDAMDESVNRTCAFPPALDPIFAPIIRAGTELTCTKRDITVGQRVDTIRTCNQINCTTIPTLHKRNGRFLCRYVAEAVLKDVLCNEEVPDCHVTVMDRIYNELAKIYLETNPTSPVLKATLLPWFEAVHAWSFDAIDLSLLLDHERNVQPNLERAVMCEISTSESEAIKFTKCNNPHYQRLQEHVATHFKHDGGVQVPAGAQLEWPLSRSLLAGGILLHYANQNRSLRQRYLDSLFDDETVCKGDPAEHVCRSTGSASFESLNPWTLGNFNPYEVCDVDFTTAGEGAREYIDFYCLDSVNSLCQQFRTNSPPTCVGKDQRLVQQVSVPRFVAGKVNDYNLCFHQTEESIDGCANDQGLLGGFDGLAVSALLDSSVTMLDNTPYKASETYNVAPNLYTESMWSIPIAFRGGVFAGTNPLWSGGIAPYGYLRIDENDIGGHRFGVVVKRVNTTDTISVMLVERINLNVDANKQFLDQPGGNSRPVEEWVPGLQAGMQAEDDATKQLYRLWFQPNQLGPSCPLQRWTFYSGGFKPFSPTLPAAQRAAHLFHRVHGGKFAHPVMHRGLMAQFLGQYRTSNGFCACPVMQSIPQVQCRVSVEETSPCSLKYTMLALLGLPDDIRTSYVFPALTNEQATRRCKMMLDWPVVDGTLKDNSTVTGKWNLASDPANKVCHVLDRFRPFQYRYQAAPSLSRDILLRNTITSGACATGRVVSLRLSVLPGPYSRCLRSSLGDTDATFACNTTTDAFTMPRRVPLSLAQLLAKRSSRRTSCGSCAPPPKFRSQHGRTVPPESSFGRLVRLSPERTLAKDLLELLCPPNSSQPCGITLNQSAWKRNEFMRNYMLFPERLFLNRTRPPARQAPVSGPVDAAWTSKGWVYCPTSSALATGQGCVGTISREEWVRKKTTLCPQMVRSYSASQLNKSNADPMARTPFCTIDRYTEAVCQAILEARQLVIQANCIASGDPVCMPSPYVYHAPSYEPSNAAWVYESVRSFYKRINGSTCPGSSENEKALFSFAQMYQRQCPANAVNLFAGLIQGVRVLVVDVALIFTTLVSLVFNGLQLLMASSYVTARVAIAKHWAFIRAKAGSSLNAFGDIMVDALLNSGEVGARIMLFLEKTCDGLNTAATWFLNVWCNFIQRYIIQFLTGMRRFLGISGATFDMIQDFIDEVFKGVLPAAFVAKYANQNFQSALLERYSQPSDERKRKKTGTSFNVPDSAARQQVGRSYQAKGLASRVFSYGKRAVTGVAAASKYLLAGLVVWETVDMAMSIAEEERLRGLYPENFTLFDLTSIADVIDELEEFILSPVSQQTCIAFQIKRKMNPDAKAFSCARVSLDSYNATRAGTTSVEPSMCWANAAPSLGQNSMFACTGASTCCETAECTTKILCASCPEPALPGINRYGCNGLRLRCACSQTVLSYSRCAANRQCSADSECELVSSLNGVSYGTIPCANCPNTARVMCLMSPTGMPARCSCMLSGGPLLDLCNDKTGLRTPVDGSKLCAYQHNRREGQTDWAFDMDDLIMLPCAQVSTGVCSVVYPTGQAELSIRMVVADSVRFSSRGRRLLLDDEQAVPEPGPPVYDAYESEYELRDSEALHALLTAPGWNTTAAPCSTLVLAYQAGHPTLSLLETHVLHRCGFWRHVGRRVIARYNLSVPMAGHETFLLSMDDFVFAVMKPEVARALLANPGTFVSALMHHPSMKPVRALGVMVANQLEFLLWQNTLTPRNGTAPLKQKTDREDRPQDHGPLITRRPIPRSKQAKIRKMPKPTIRTPAGRRLLDVQDVLAYSVRVLKDPDSISMLPARVFGAWSTEHFVWPPRYNYTLAACPIALTTYQLLSHLALVNTLYFTNFNAQRPPVSRKLRDNLPDLAWTARLAPSEDVVSAKSWPSAAFRWMLGVVGTKPEQFVALFTSDYTWSFAWLLNSLTACDLAATLTCSASDRDPLMSTLVFVLLFFLVRAASSALEISFVSILFLLSYPWFILWYTYGLAPSCFPSLPTCLLADIIHTLEFLLPPRLAFHSSLVCGGANETVSCLRSCEHLGFVDWVDPLAFAVCDIDDAVCSNMQASGPLGVEWLDAFFYSPLLSAMQRFQTVIRAGNAGGHRVCTWVSFVYVVPVVALIISGVAILSALVAGLLDMLPFLVHLLLQAFVFYDT